METVFWTSSGFSSFKNLFFFRWNIPCSCCLLTQVLGLDWRHHRCLPIQVDYSDLDDDPEAEEPQKQLVYYELDLVCVAGVFPWAQHTIWSAILAE